MAPTANDQRIADLRAELAAAEAGQPAADQPTEAERTAELFKSLARRTLAGDDLHAFAAEVDDLLGLVEPADVDEPPAYADPLPPNEPAPAQTPTVPHPGPPAQTTPPPAPGSLD